MDKDAPKENTIHINKIPSDTYNFVQQRMESEGRSARKVSLILLNAAIKIYEEHHCENLDQFAKNCGIKIP